MFKQHEASRLPDGCPFGHVEQVVAIGAAATRDVSPALTCALLSDCPHRVACLARMSDLIEEMMAARSEMAA